MTKSPSFWTSSQGVASLVLIGAVTYFLLMEHRTHFFQFLPFLIILLCPAMHLFMHRGHGHGGHGGHGGHQGDEGSIHGRPEDSTEKDAYLRGIEEGRKQALSGKPSGGRRG